MKQKSQSQDAKASSQKVVKRGQNRAKIGSSMSQKHSPNKAQIPFLGAAKSAILIREKRISSVELCKELLAHIKATNPQINAICIDTSEQALKTAKLADDLLAKKLVQGPLHGVPATLKNNVNLKNYETTHGGVFSDIAQENGAVADAVHKALCPVLGLSNLPEFALRWSTDNPRFGQTLNPINKKLTPGGSSGGAAAALASGMGALAQGNDIGGSLRYPAHCCGVFALRPSPGAIAQYDGEEGRSFVSQHFSTEGPMARSVEDLELFFHILRGRNPLDPLSAFAPKIAQKFAPKRVAVVTSIKGLELDSFVQKSLEIAQKALAQSGWELEEIELDDFCALHRIWTLLLFAEKRVVVGDLLERYGSDAVRLGFWGMAKHTFGEDLSILEDMSAYVEAHKNRDFLRQKYALLLERFAALILPVSATRAFDLGADDASRVSEDDYFRLCRNQMPLTATVALGLPALAVPVGFAKDAGGKIPLGLQIMSGFFREDLCFRVARDIEKACPVWP